MERTILLGSLGLGVVGWLCTLLLAQMRAAGLQSENRDNTSRAFLWLAIALPVGVWALTLPTLPPFSGGQGWGRGFLLGGAGALASALVILGAASHVSPRRIATAPLFAALPIVCIPLLWMRHAMIEALLGAALGWIAVSLILLLSSGARDSERDESNEDRALLLLNGSAFAATLCAAATLGVYRDFVVATVARGTYSAIAVGLAGSVAVALLSGALWNEIAPRNKETTSGSSATPASSAFSILFCLALPLGFGYLLATKLLDEIELLYLISAGLLLGFILWWLARDSTARSENTASGLPFAAPPLAILVALCGFMLAYQIGQGFGAGILLLAAWPAALLALPSKVRPNSGVLFADEQTSARNNVTQTLTLLLSFIAVLLVSRVFATRFRVELRNANFSDQFAVFGFVAGVAIPAWLASLAPARANSATETHADFWHSGLPRLFVIGLLSLAVPGAMLALWGAKIVPAFFAGLAVAVAGFAAASQRGQAIAALLGLAISCAVAQWTQRLAPLAEVSRAQRLQFLLWALAALVFSLLVFDYGARLVFWMRARHVVKGVSP